MKNTINMKVTEGIGLKDLSSEIDKVSSFLPVKMGIQLSEVWKSLL